MEQLMIKSLRLSLIAIFIFNLQSCDTSDSTDDILGDWTKVVPYQGNPRSGATQFTINEKAYSGLGYDGEDYQNDFYYYDATLAYWSEANAFPGLGREKSVSFAVGGKGYVGLGYNRDELTEELNDFWSYDPQSNQWTQLADFPGGRRYNAVAFVINEVPYVGTGYDGSKFLSDIYKYNVSNDTWTKITGYPGEKVESAISFTVNGKAYLCGGKNNGLYNSVMWEYNPDGSRWTDVSKTDDDDDYEEFLDAVSRVDAAVTVSDSRVFIIGGTASNVVSRETFEYDPIQNRWIQKTDLEAVARHSLIGFVLNERIFIGLGQAGTSYFDDVWEFHPDDEYDSSK